jgi:hypothetical protein
MTLGNLDANGIGRYDNPHNTVGLSFAGLLNQGLAAVSAGLPMQYEQISNALIARLGFQVTSQAIRRQGRMIMLNFTCTKNSGNWVNADIPAEINVARLRPDGSIVVGTGWDSNSNLQARQLLVIPSGPLQLLGVGGLAGTNPINCFAMYIVDAV